jgi:Importin repeat
VVTAALLKMPLRLTKLFAILLKMLLDVDDMAWPSVQPEGKEIDQSGNYTLALECLDRLVFALGGNTVLKAADEMLPAYLIDSDRKMRHTALIALAQISQGCSMVSP